jgi:hypothetical protein
MVLDLPSEARFLEDCIQMIVDMRGASHWVRPSESLEYDSLLCRKTFFEYQFRFIVQSPFPA